jgi:hypothetical protein
MPAVLFESCVALLLRPALQRRALACVVEERHTVATRGLHQVNVDADDLSRAEWLFVFECRSEQRGVVACVARKACPAAIEPQDRWRFIKGAEHEGDAAVGAQMSSRLAATAGQVEIDNSARVENTQGIRGPR